MVFTEFTNKGLFSLLAVIGAFSSFTSSADEPLQWPVYAAQLSEESSQQCQTNVCSSNVLDAGLLSELLTNHPLSYDVHDALGLSEYELLVSSALLSRSDEQDQQLLIELTTSWRGIPVDDFIVDMPFQGSKRDALAIAVDQWVSRVKEQEVFSAERIYNIIGASDYENQLQLPETIGDFVRSQTALYHDPLQGSITRYLHPEFVDAVVDVSVYPVSPFAHQTQNFQESLSAEMQTEKSQIESLIQQSQMQDYEISDIQHTEIVSGGKNIPALAIEVALETKIDPIYSTQFLFTQNDKFVKLTGNLPKRMMVALVNESVSQIQVPQESSFMQSMRN